MNQKNKTAKRNHYLGIMKNIKPRVVKMKRKRIIKPKPAPIMDIRWTTIDGLNSMRDEYNRAYYNKKKEMEQATPPKQDLNEVARSEEPISS